jgi:hypothetical protein
MSNGNVDRFLYVTSNINPRGGGASDCEQVESLVLEYDSTNPIANLLAETMVKFSKEYESENRYSIKQNRSDTPVVTNEPPAKVIATFQKAPGFDQYFPNVDAEGLKKAMKASQKFNIPITDMMLVLCDEDETFDFDDGDAIREYLDGR